MAIWQHLRSSTVHKRPTTSLADGRLAINTNGTSPGLFFKDSAGTGIVKVGPVHVGTTAPNSSPAVGGSSGNYTGEQWLDTSVAPAQLKVWNGSAWVGIVADELPVSKLQDGTAGQIVQTDSAGTGVEWSNTTNLPLGSAASPAYSFQGDSNTGLYSPGADQLAISTGGVRSAFFSGNETRLGAPNSNTVVLNIGEGATGDRAVYTDLVTDTTYSDFGLRLGREAGTNSTSFLWHRGTGSLNLTANEAAPILFSTAGQERLRITSDGKVGIGTSTPSGRLDVADGDVYITKNSGGDLPGVTSQSLYLKTQSGDLARLYAVSSGSGGPGGFGGTLYVQTKSDNAALANRITIADNGKVGIGTSSPGCSLDVAGITRIGAPTGDAQLEIGAGATGNRNAFIDLVGDTTYTDYGLRLIRDNSGPNAFSALRHRGTGSLTLLTEEAAPITFQVSLSERVRIDSSGRLLVGTSSAISGAYSSTAKLEVVSTSSAPYYTGSFYGYHNDVNPTVLQIGHSRSSSVGHAILQNGDAFGTLRFEGSDGTNFIEGASITAYVAGTPGANDMPGRLVFSTTADGAATPTERMRIKNDGTINFSNVATYVDNAAATASGLAVGDVYRTATGQLMICY